MKNNLLWWYEVFLRQGASIKRWAKLEKVTEMEMEFIVNMCAILKSGVGRVGDKNLIEQAMKKTGCTQAELARISGADRSVITNVLKGRRGLGKKNRELIARFAGIDITHAKVNYNE